MKRVLVTGAGGFIGRQTLPFLEEHGFQVYVSSGVNLLDPMAMLGLVKTVKPTHLLHLAWYAKPPEYWESPLNVAWLKASLDLLEAFCDQGGERAVFAGTCAEYDWQYGLCKESVTPCLPRTLYGAAKYSLSLLAEKMAIQKKISFASGRIFFLFGPHEYPNRLISGVICHAIEQKKFTVNSAYQIRDFIYVKDVASALVALLSSSVTGPVNIGSGQCASIGEMVKVLATKLRADCWIEYQYPAQKKDIVLIPDLNRLFEEVAWKPNYTFNQAIDETISWWEGQFSHG